MPTTLSIAHTSLRRWSLWNKGAAGHLSTGISWGRDREWACTNSLCFCTGFWVKGPRFGEVSNGGVVLALGPEILPVFKRLLHLSHRHAHLRVPPVPSIAQHSTASRVLQVQDFSPSPNHLFAEGAEVYGGHTARKWQGQGLKPGQARPTPEPVVCGTLRGGNWEYSSSPSIW